MSVTIGIKTLKYAPVGAGGTPGTPTTEVKTAQDTLTFNPPDQTTVTVPIDQSNTPIYNKIINGAKTFQFTIPDPDNTTRAVFMGGTVAAGVYTPSEDDSEIHMTMEITPMVGDIRTYNDVTVSADENGTLGKTNNLGLVVVCTINKPSDGTSPVYTTTDPNYEA